MLKRLIEIEMERQDLNGYRFGQRMEELGYRASHIYNWLSGSRNISLRTFEEMCVALRVKPVLVPLAKDEEPPPLTPLAPKRGAAEPGQTGGRGRNLDPAKKKARKKRVRGTKRL